MNRPAVRCGLRRGRLEFGRVAIRSQQSGESRVFCTTQPTCEDEGRRPTTSRERSAAAASELGAMKSNAGAIDARALGASGAASSGTIITPSKVVNLRSLRGTIGDNRRPQRFGVTGRFRDSAGLGFQALNNARGGGGAGGFERSSRFGDRPGFTPRGGRSGPRGGGDFSRPERRADSFAGARTPRSRSGGRSDRDDRDMGIFRDGMTEEEVEADIERNWWNFEDDPADIEANEEGGEEDEDLLEELETDKSGWNAEEQKYVDDLEQGVVTPYTPVVTLESLRGYGPALATDTKLGKVETAMQNMRVLGGGRAYNATTTYAHDVKDDYKRYFGEKKPLFFDTMAEREWVEGSRKDLKMHPPSTAIKSTIVQAAIAGHYRGPKYADARNVTGLIANYHSRDFLYTHSKVKMFEDKAQVLLPNMAAGGAKQAAKSA